MSDYLSRIGGMGGGEPAPKLEEVLFQDALIHGTETPQWMLRLDEIFESTIEVQVDEGKTNYTTCFGFKMHAKRQISGSRLTQHFISSSCNHSRIWFVVPLDKSTPSLSIKLHDGTIIKKTCIVRLGNIGTEFNKPLWQATFEEANIEYFEIVRDYVLFSVSVNAGEQKIFQYTPDGKLKGQSVSSYDYSTNTGKPPE
ncbi:MAG: hypothetical protein HEEMFOPI_01209 [Holosporales bacterium]